MNLRTLMQTGPARANELFARLADTSDGAVKTRERLFAELKAELELHTRLEEEHLFPVLRRHAQKELVADAIRDNRELLAALNEIDALPKGDETFLGRLKELQKAFRQHARDEKTEILPAVQQALSEEQVQTVAGKIEASRAEAEQARQEEAEERRQRARQEREQAEQQAQQAEAAERQRREAEREARAQAQQAREAARLAAEAAMTPAAVATDITREAARLGRDAAAMQARQAATARQAGMPFAELFLWPWAGAMSGKAPRHDQAEARAAAGAEEVIPLGEEVLEIGTRSVERSTARIRRYVVETPVERQVTLRSERVVVERRRPVGEGPHGEVLTEVTVEVTETDEVPVVEKRVRLREEIVVRTERTQRVETVRATLRHDEVEVQQPGRRRAPHLRAIEAGQD